MTLSHDAGFERLQLLLSLRETGPLAEQEWAELSSLLERYPEADPERYAPAAAAFALAFSQSAGELPEAMPAAVRERVLRSGIEQVATNALVRSGVLPSGAMSMPSDPPGTGSGAVTSMGLVHWAGWVAAIAASVALLLSLRNGIDRPASVITSPLLEMLEEQGAGVDDERWGELLRMGDSIVLMWKAGPTPLENPAAGGIIWNQSRQFGLMRFEGLPVNDPATEQYQLWIIDPQRDQHPVDGGVFDIPDARRSIVRVQAKLPVIAPTAFAITIEKPGGVVVSDQSRLPLIAAIQESR